MSCELALSARDYKGMESHLLPQVAKSEEALFAYVHATMKDGRLLLKLVEWETVPEDGFADKSLFGFELTDECRAAVIKRAHTLEASIMEFHSHPLARVVAFSPSDCYGFGEFVPHVRWRLKQRPYFAAVLGRKSFDSLYWLSSSERPDGVVDLQVGRKRFEPTGLSARSWEAGHGLSEV